MPRFPDNFERIFGAVFLELFHVPKRVAKHTSVVTTAETPVGREHKQRADFFVIRTLFQQGVRELQVGPAEVTDDLGDLLRVGRRFGGSVHGFLEATPSRSAPSSA